MPPLHNPYVCVARTRGSRIRFGLRCSATKCTYSRTPWQLKVAAGTLRDCFAIESIPQEILDRIISNLNVSDAIKICAAGPSVSLEGRIDPTMYLR